MRLKAAIAFEYREFSTTGAGLPKWLLKIIAAVCEEVENEHGENILKMVNYFLTSEFAEK